MTVKHETEERVLYDELTPSERIAEQQIIVTPCDGPVIELSLFPVDILGIGRLSGGGTSLRLDNGPIDVEEAPENIQAQIYETQELLHERKEELRAQTSAGHSEVPPGIRLLGEAAGGEDGDDFARTDHLANVDLSKLDFEDLDDV